MSTLRPRGSSFRPTLRLAGLLVVLGGLFGMHGLADHGTGGMEMAPHGAISARTTASLSPGVERVTTALIDHAEALAQPEIAVSDPRDSGTDMSMSALCVAALVAGLFALLLLLLSSRKGPVLWFRPRRVRVPGRPGRAPDPPSLFVLSIQRC